MNSLEGIAASCLGCPKPSCEAHCPLHNPIRDCLRLFSEGKKEQAAELLYAHNPFPELTGSLCEGFCAASCIKRFRGEGISFAEFERQIAQYPRKITKEKPNGRKIAIIGAGPAGIACAYSLSLSGFSVEVFEREREIGGCLYCFIPEFRFDLSLLSRIRESLELLGVKFHLGVEASYPILGFDETVLAVGALEPRIGGFELSKKIQTGLSFLYGLRHQGLKVEKGERYYVYGGGNVALDALRSIARAGGEATLVYRRSQAEMPGDHRMLSLALEEGAKASFLRCIVSASEDYLSIAPTHLGEAGEDGRRNFEVDEAKAAPLPYDHLILCLGQTSRHLGEENAIGDAKEGAKDVASAIASGLEFALAAKRRFP